MFNGVPVEKKYIQIFIEEFQLCTEDSMIIDGACVCMEIIPQASLVGRFAPRRFTSCPESEFASFLSPGKLLG